MFQLNSDAKRKLVRDLSADIKLRNWSFEFKGKKLWCHSDNDACIVIDYKKDFDVRNYNQLFRGTLAYVHDFSDAALNMKVALIQLPYAAFIKKIKAIRYKKRDDKTDIVIHVMGDYMYKFSATLIYFDRTGMHEMTLIITPEILISHNVTVEKFFEDVRECYTKDGVDIMCKSYPTI